MRLIGTGIWMMMGIALMGGCTSDDVVHKTAQETVPISFASDGVDSPTKAEITDGWMQTNGTGQFGVYGYKGTTTLFTNERVYRENDDWLHSTVRYWDKTGIYDFYAYAPYNAAGIRSTDGRFTFTGNQVFMPISDAGTEDIVVAEPHRGRSYDYYHSATNANGRVNFIFHHILSKLTFQFKKHQDVVATITVTDVKIGFPTCKSWTWNQTDNTAWGGCVSYNGYAESGGTSSLTPPADELGITTSSEATPSFIVVPVSTTNHAMSMTVTYQLQYTDGIKDTHTKTVSIGSIAFAQNTQYIITATISPQAIKFDASALNNWTDDPIAIELQEDSTTP